MKNFVLALLLFQNSPQPVGIVTGVVNGPNGMPASGVRVFAIEAREKIDPAKSSLALESISVTDDMGRYRLEIATGRYYIASGSVESPTFSPGTSDISGAREVRVTAGTVVSNIDFSSFVPASRTQFGFTQLSPGSTGVLSGVISHADGTPASGIAVNAVPSPLSTGTMSASSYSVIQMMALFRGQVRSDANGRYSINYVAPGTYVIAAGFAESPTFYPGTSDIVSAKAITTTPATNLGMLDFTVPVWTNGARISGRVTASAQSPALGGVVRIRSSSAVSQAIAAVGFPSRLPQFAVPLDADGRFAFLGEGYAIKSITSDGKDLLKETVKVGKSGHVNVEIRIRKKTTPEPGEVRLSGKALDAVTGAPAAAELVTICCRDAGITERFSTPLGSDGSFEFKSIPPGHYNVGLQVASGRPNLYVVDSRVDVGSRGVTGREIQSAQRFVSVMAITTNEAGGHLDAGSSTSVVFVGASPRNRVVATQGDPGVWSALLPGGDVYTATVENLPTGFSVKSTSGPMDFRTYAPAINAIGAPPPDPVARITLTTP